MAESVLIPLLNPNEPEALLSSLFVEEGDQVAAGDLICSLETTKSVADLHAEKAGYVAGLQYQIGETVLAGDLLCYIAESRDWKAPVAEKDIHEGVAGNAIPDGLRITRPARQLAESAGIDLSKLPVGPMITEVDIKVMVDQENILTSPEKPFDPEQIIVYGGGGHGKALIDLLLVLNQYRIFGVIDDGMRVGEKVMEVPILGGGAELKSLYHQGIRQAVNAVGGIGSVLTRRRVFQRLAEAGFSCPTVTHPTAFIERNAVIAPGVQVFPLAYVGSEVEIGFGSIINTSAVISHECQLGDYCNISPGTQLAGGVVVGDGTLIGMGVTVNLQVQIGTGARIGNGATIKEDVPSNTVVRAGSTWPD